MNIVYETKNFLILNKPAGLLVHGSVASGDEPTLVDWLLQQHLEIDGVGEDWVTEGKGGEELVIKRSGIVHRLDRDTSGLLVVARTQEFFDHMKRQFKNHLVEKVYRAFTYGQPKADEGEIDAPIGKSKKDFRRWSAQRGARGAMRDAFTAYHVLDRFEDESGAKFSHMEFRPRTGRTHQIRVHAKYMNHSIVGDALYAGKLFEQSENLGFKRQALHAHQITFSDIDGSEQSFTASFPSDFQQAVDRYVPDKV